MKSTADRTPENVVYAYNNTHAMDIILVYDPVTSGAIM